MSVVRVLDHGQITIPKKLREALDIKKGDLADVELDGDRVVITPRRLVQQKAHRELLFLLEQVHRQNPDASEEQVTQDVLQAIAELRKDEYAHAKKTSRCVR